MQLINTENLFHEKSRMIENEQNEKNCRNIYFIYFELKLQMTLRF